MHGATATVRRAGVGNPWDVTDGSWGDGDSSPRGHGKFVGRHGRVMGRRRFFVRRSCAPGTVATARPCVCFAALVPAVCAGRRRMRRFRMQRTTARGLIQAHHGRAVGVECGLAQGLGQHVCGVFGGGNVVGFVRNACNPEAQASCVRRMSRSSWSCCCPALI